MFADNCRWAKSRVVDERFADQVSDTTILNNDLLLINQSVFVNAILCAKKTKASILQKLSDMCRDFIEQIARLKWF
jgi:hypothetical protein